MNNPQNQNAPDASDIFMANKEERNAYIRREMAIMDQVSDREDFIQEGFEKGFDQAVNRIITNMIQAGLDDSQISKFTNQSLETIQQVREALRSTAAAASTTRAGDHVSAAAFTSPTDRTAVSTFRLPSRPNSTDM